MAQKTEDSKKGVCFSEGPLNRCAELAQHSTAGTTVTLYATNFPPFPLGT